LYKFKVPGVMYAVGVIAKHFFYFMPSEQYLIIYVQIYST